MLRTRADDSAEFLSARTHCLCRNGRGGWPRSQPGEGVPGMARPIGPTIPRWQLGEQLSQLRSAAGKSQQDAANRLGCSISKIQKIEAGEVGSKPVELE